MPPGAPAGILIAMTDRFERLPDSVFAPLAGRPAEAWYAAPPGRWSPAQIVQHLAMALDASARRFEERADKPPMTRRPLTPRERLLRLLVFGLGLFPPGRKAPEVTTPAERPDHQAAVAQMRDGVRRFLELRRRLLPARRHDLFVKHPVFGDCTLEEWMRFHVRHTEHHLKQIRARVGTV